MPFWLHNVFCCLFLLLYTKTFWLHVSKLVTRFQTGYMSPIRFTHDLFTCIGEHNISLAFLYVWETVVLNCMVLLRFCGAP